MEDTNRHRARTLSVTSVGSVLSCSTIPPVTIIQHFQDAYWVTPVGFPGGASGKEPAYQCRRHKWQPTLVFLPTESPWTGAWRATVHRVTELDTTERLSTRRTPRSAVG